MANAKSISKKKKEKIVKNKSFYLQKFKLNASIGGYVAGNIISLKCCKKTKVPVDGYWRRRLNEAVMDNCIEIYVESRPAKPVKPAKDSGTETKNEDK